MRRKLPGESRDEAHHNIPLRREDVEPGRGAAGEDESVSGESQSMTAPDKQQDSATRPTRPPQRVAGRGRPTRGAAEGGQGSGGCDCDRVGGATAVAEGYAESFGFDGLVG